MMIILFYLKLDQIDFIGGKFDGLDFIFARYTLHFCANLRLSILLILNHFKLRRIFHFYLLMRL